MGRIIFPGITTSLDPATLALTAYWVAPYSGSPWAGTASAGTSGSNTASNGSHAPSVGSPLNGHNVASADGVANQLTLSGTGATYVTDTAWSMFCVMRVNSVSIATGSVVNDPALLADNGGAFGINYTNEGITPFIQTTAGLKDVAVPVPSPSAWRVYSARFDGTNLGAGANGPPTDNVVNASGPNIMSPAFRTLRLFTNFQQMEFLHADVACIGLAATALSDAQFVGIYNFLKAEFAL